MPRKPTEKVIEHRITLGTYERQILSDAVTSYNFKNVATPLVSAFSDVSFLIFLGGLIGVSLDSSLRGTAWRTATKLLDADGYRDWLENQNLLGAAVAGGYAGSRFGFYGFITGLVAGTVGVEIGEDVLEPLADIPSNINANLIQLQLYWGIKEVEESQKPLGGIL